MKAQKKNFVFVGMFNIMFPASSVLKLGNRYNYYGLGWFGKYIVELLVTVDERPYKNLLWKESAASAFNMN